MKPRVECRLAETSFNCAHKLVHWQQSDEWFRAATRLLSTAQDFATGRCDATAAGESEEKPGWIRLARSGRSFAGPRRARWRRKPRASRVGRHDQVELRLGDDGTVAGGHRGARGEGNAR